MPTILSYKVSPWATRRTLLPHFALQPLHHKGFRCPTRHSSLFPTNPGFPFYPLSLSASPVSGPDFPAGRFFPAGFVGHGKPLILLASRPFLACFVLQGFTPNCAYNKITPFCPPTLVPQGFPVSYKTPFPFSSQPRVALESHCRPRSIQGKRGFSGGRPRQVRPRSGGWPKGWP